jgi:hypothetical protein
MSYSIFEDPCKNKYYLKPRLHTKGISTYVNWNLTSFLIANH